MTINYDQTARAILEILQTALHGLEKREVERQLLAKVHDRLTPKELSKGCCGGSLLLVPGRDTHLGEHRDFGNLTAYQIVE